MLRKDFRFNKAFNICDEIHNKRSKLNECKPRSADDINKKTMPTLLRIIEDRLIGMFSAPSIIKEVNNANQKAFEHDDLKRNWRVKIHATLQKKTVNQASTIISRNKAGNNSQKLKNYI